jgi:beta-phosphoglucomutase-like phosphatase (HAD superfamily)
MDIDRIAFIDLDGVIANNEARFARATMNGKIDWQVAFDPELVTLDTLIDGVQTQLDNLESQGYTIIYLTSRPESMRAATLTWLDKHGLATRMLVMKSAAFQFTKTVVWKAGMVNTLANAFQAREVIVVDDEQANIDEIMKHVTLQAKYASLAEIV